MSSQEKRKNPQTFPLPHVARRCRRDSAVHQAQTWKDLHFNPPSWLLPLFPKTPLVNQAQSGWGGKFPCSGPSFQATSQSQTLVFLSFFWCLLYWRHFGSPEYLEATVPYPQYDRDFPEEIREKCGKTPETLSELFLEFPSRVRLGSPKPYTMLGAKLSDQIPVDFNLTLTMTPNSN